MADGFKGANAVAMGVLTKLARAPKGSKNAETREKIKEDDPDVKALKKDLDKLKSQIDKLESKKE